MAIRTPLAVAPTAVDDGLAQLHVFISYASEDVRLAQTIDAGLRNAFPPGSFKIALASNLKIGSQWRTELEAALREAEPGLPERGKSAKIRATSEVIRGIPV
jgi:hypothetical protein